MSGRRLTAVAVASMASLALLPATSSAQDIDNGRITYVSNEAGGNDIYSVRPDGMGRRVLVDGETSLSDPIDSDPGGFFGFGPSQADGFLYTAGRGGGNSQVRGSFDETTIDYTRKRATDRQPVPRFGGFEIVYVSDRDGDDELRFTTAFDDLAPRQFRAVSAAAEALGSGGARFQRGQKITDNGASDRDPTVAPFSGRFAFTSDRSGNDEIWFDDRKPRRLTNDPAPDYQPAFSYGGRSLAFVSERDGNPEIYLAELTREDILIKRLTDNLGADTEPSFSPNGKKIAFVSDRNGNSDIYTMKIDGSAQRNVTRAPLGADISPHWGTRVGPFDCFIEGDFTTLRGTEGADSLIGSGEREVIRSFGGRDTARGRGGQDCIFGEDEGDLLFGNGGQDKLVGAGGFDRLHGGRGRDKLDGGSSSDKLRGGAKTDALVGGRGNDRLDGGTGVDLLIGEAGDDQLLGGSGNDVIFAGLGRDRVRCGRGRDMVFAERNGVERIGKDCERVFRFGNGATVRQFGLAFQQYFDTSGRILF